MATRSALDRINYAQVWEDADLLLKALAVQPGEHCLSIASAGDNALAMLVADPAKVMAIDLNPAQLACLSLRAAAYRALDHEAFLELYGARESRHRDRLYARCRPLLEDAETVDFWDRQRRAMLIYGFAGIGRLERYLVLFRRLILPLVHGSSTVAALLEPKGVAERRRFFDRRWNSRRWRLLFRCFFSRRTMQGLGRDPAFFTYAEQSVSAHLLARTRWALVDLDPSCNPYLHRILTGRFGRALPLALRPEHYQTIRARLDRLEPRCISMESVLEDGTRFDRMNLSNVFEYMSETAFCAALDQVRKACRKGGRVVFWNMLVPRAAGDCPEWRTLSDPHQGWLSEDKAFFYSAFHALEAV